jgi:hypothetical protein
MDVRRHLRWYNDLEIEVSIYGKKETNVPGAADGICR